MNSGGCGNIKQLTESWGCTGHIGPHWGEGEQWCNRYHKQALHHLLQPYHWCHGDPEEPIVTSPVAQKRCTWNQHKKQAWCDNQDATHSLQRQWWWPTPGQPLTCKLQGYKLRIECHQLKNLHSAWCWNYWSIRVYSVWELLQLQHDQNILTRELR